MRTLVALLPSALALSLTFTAAAAAAEPDDALLPPPPTAPPDAVDREDPTPPAPPPASPPSPDPHSPVPPSPRPTPAPDLTTPPLPPSAPAPPSAAPPDTEVPAAPPPPASPDDGFVAESPAELPPTDARPQRPPPRRWYGWQIIVLDGTALANFATQVWPLSLPVFYLGAPITHLAHKAPLKAAISEGLRIVVPYATGQLGAQFRHCDVGNTHACAHGIHPGAVLGAVAVSAFDIAVLGQRSVLETPPAPTPPPTVSVYPSGSVDRHGFTLTASGAF